MADLERETRTITQEARATGDDPVGAIENERRWFEALVREAIRPATLPSVVQIEQRMKTLPNQVEFSDAIGEMVGQAGDVATAMAFGWRVAMATPKRACEAEERLAEILSGGDFDQKRMSYVFDLVALERIEKERSL